MEAGWICVSGSGAGSMRMSPRARRSVRSRSERIIVTSPPTPLREGEGSKERGRLRASGIHDTVSVTGIRHGVFGGERLQETGADGGGERFDVGRGRAVGDQRGNERAHEVIGAGDSPVAKPSAAPVSTRSRSAPKK